MTQTPIDPIDEGPGGKPNPTQVTEGDEAVNPADPGEVDDQ
jgi:hypothetical protein